MKYYNLDVIISVGYRVKSIRGTQFRKWASERLKEYIIKGFTMDDERLKGNGEGKIKIDHLDCHHHLIDNENIKKAIIKIANENNLKVRKMFDSDLKSPDIFYTDFSINNVNINALETMIEKYQTTDYTVELLTHSGYIDEYTKEITSYVGRDKELQVLEEAYDKGIFNSIPLISYDEL